jgi:UDP-N-acetylmuramyl pentapeptide phosphotransferase/UDP-N-acetylglucosamine-1-phosphate transferase
MLSPILAFAVSALATLLLLAGLLRVGLAHRLALDQPNARSLHAAPVPRIGGAVVVPVALATALLLTDLPWAHAACALALAIMGFVDDRRGLPVGLRLTVQAAVAAALVASAGLPQPSAAVVIGLTVATLWAMNAFNFMDGSDGLAGGMALIGFGTCSLAAALAGDPALASLCAALAGAALGFLRFNFAPAQVFLGDAGSVPLGLLAAAVAIHGVANETLPAWFVPLVFSPFLIDASFTLLLRAAAGQRIWQAHREHVYQRMVRSGLGHRRTALLAYAVMLAGAVLSLAALALPPGGQATLVAGWIVVSVTGFALLRRRWSAS